MGDNIKAEHLKTLQNIAKFYNTKYSIGPGATSKSIKLDGSVKTSAAFLKLYVLNQDIVKKHCGRKPYNELVDFTASNYGLDADKDIIAYLSDLVFDALSKKVKKAHVDKAIKSLNDMGGFGSFNYTDIIPIMDVETGQTVLFNQTTMEVVHEAAYDAYESWVKKQDQEVKAMLNSDLLPALVRYNPAESGGTTMEKVEHQEVSCINSHNKPEWRRKELKNPKMPKVFDELMKHLFPESECRQYIYVWMYHMLTSRNSMHLLLHGARGIGKNSLVEIMAALVGQSNYYSAPKEFWDNNFNSELRHRRLIYFDEHKISERENLSQFKIYSDARMAYHGKGISIKNIEKNHASHIIANNLEEVNHLVQESRRFSVPVLTQENISDVWGNEKVEHLWTMREDQDFLSNLGWWILKNAPIDKFHKDRPYKSALFYEIVNKALFPWKAWIIETIESREAEEIRLSDYQEDKLSYRGQPIGRIKIETFLASHKDMDGDYYGYVKQVDGERIIFPSKKYLPKTENNKVDEDFSDMEF